MSPDLTGPHPDARFRVALRSATDAEDKPSPIPFAKGRTRGRKFRRTIVRPANQLILIGRSTG